MEALETSVAARPVGSQSRIVLPNNIASEASESETLTVAALGSHVESLRQSMEQIHGAVASLAAQVMQRVIRCPAEVKKLERRSNWDFTVWRPSCARGGACMHPQKRRSSGWPQADARDAAAETATDRAVEAMADVRLQLTSVKQRTDQIQANVQTLTTELAQESMDDSAMASQVVAEAVATRMDQLESMIEELQALSQSQQQLLSRTTSTVTGLATKVEATPPPPSPSSSHATAAEVAQLQATTLTLEAQVN